MNISRNDFFLNNVFELKWEQIVEHIIEHHKVK